MENIMLWVAVFSAGAVVGALLTLVLPIAGNSQKKFTDLVGARARILAGIKENHEQEILREIFRTTESLQGDLNRALRLLRDLMETLLNQVRDDWQAQQENRLH
jgi:hypothetical protein